MMSNLCLSEFHVDLIGLTVKKDEIRKVGRAYRLYYMKTEEEGSEYLVDCSIVVYVSLISNFFLFSCTLFNY